MYIFLFSVTVLYYFFLHEIEGRTLKTVGCGFNFFTGSVTSAVYCFIGFLFSYSYRNPEYSFADNFSYIFLYGTLFPVLCCLLIYVVLSKDAWQHRVMMFSDVLTAFYAVFLPYRIFSVYDDPDYYFLFIIPVVWICCLFIFRKMTVYMVHGKRGVLFKTVAAFVAVCVLFLCPPALETLYFMDYRLWVRILCEVLLVLLSASAFFVFRIEKADPVVADVPIMKNEQEPLVHEDVPVVEKPAPEVEGPKANVEDDVRNVRKAGEGEKGKKKKKSGKKR